MELVEIARAAVRAASELLANATASEIRAKGDPNDIVTEWDTRSEAAIRTVLRDASPYAILGEEGGEQEGEGEYRWIVDPIDGTVNFAHGLPLWSIVVACERIATRETVVGVIGAPILGWHFEAIAGGGAIDNGAPMRVSSRGTIKESLLVTGFPYDRATNPENNFAEWEYVQRRAGACRRLGCASLDLCLVARGALDGYWERHLKAWDIAGGALLVREAGGTVTDTRGGSFDPHSGDVCATNGAIHTELIGALAAARLHR